MGTRGSSGRRLRGERAGPRQRGSRGVVSSAPFGAGGQGHGAEGLRGESTAPWGVGVTGLRGPGSRAEGWTWRFRANALPTTPASGRRSRARATLSVALQPPLAAGCGQHLLLGTAAPLLVPFPVPVPHADCCDFPAPAGARHRRPGLPADWPARGWAPPPRAWSQPPPRPAPRLATHSGTGPPGRLSSRGRCPCSPCPPSGAPASCRVGSA